MTDTTDRYKLLLKLNPSQALALEIVDRGGSHAEAAEAAGVDRTTVARWVNHHPAFISEMNRRRLDRARSNERALAEIDQKALFLIRQAMEGGEHELAFRWFKIRGFSPVPSAADRLTDPVELIEQRSQELPNEYLGLMRQLEHPTPAKAIDEIWGRLEGALDLRELPELDEREFFLDLEKEDMPHLTADDIELFTADLDWSDPEIVRHARELGIKLESEGVSSGQDDARESDAHE